MSKELILKQIRSNNIDELIHSTLHDLRDKLELRAGFNLPDDKLVNNVIIEWVRSSYRLKKKYHILE